MADFVFTDEIDAASPLPPLASRMLRRTARAKVQGGGVSAGRAQAAGEGGGGADSVLVASCKRSGRAGFSRSQRLQSCSEAASRARTRTEHARTHRGARMQVIEYDPWWSAGSVGFTDAEQARLPRVHGVCAHARCRGQRRAMDGGRTGPAAVAVVAIRGAAAYAAATRQRRRCNAAAATPPLQRAGDDAPAPAARGRDGARGHAPTRLHAGESRCTAPLAHSRMRARARMRTRPRALCSRAHACAHARTHAPARCAHMTKQDCIHA